MLIDLFIEKSLFSHHYQPIFQLHQEQCIGFEALLRSTDFPNPELAFQAAKRSNKLYELDTASIEKAIMTFAQSSVSQGDTLLFVNVLPSTLINEKFLSFIYHVLNMSQLRPEQIVLEVSESEQMDEMLNYIHIIDQLSAHGFQIALDDVGKGYSNFDVIISMPFNFIKLDRVFTDRIDRSPKKQSLVQLFKDYCEKEGISLILEGLETAEEHKKALALGAMNAQGYFLGRPAAIEDYQGFH